MTMPDDREAALERIRERIPLRHPGSCTPRSARQCSVCNDMDSLLAAARAAGRAEVVEALQRLREDILINAAKGLAYTRVGEWLRTLDALLDEGGE